MADIENRKNEELLSELNEEKLEKVSGGQVKELNRPNPKELPPVRQTLQSRWESREG